MEMFIKDYSAWLLSFLSGIIIALWRFMAIFKDLALIQQRVEKLERDFENETQEIKSQMDRIESKLDNFIFRDLK